MDISEIKIGRKVKYYPIIDREDCKETEIRSEAWNLGHGETVCKVKGIAGGVSIRHLEPISE